MGYFSNGSQGMDYEEYYCSECKHNEQCMVWLLHLNYNYDQFKNETIKAILDMFIPQTELGNDKCRMFIAEETKEVIPNCWKMGADK